jgi:hypothetical protein
VKTEQILARLLAEIKAVLVKMYSKGNERRNKTNQEKADAWLEMTETYLKRKQPTSEEMEAVAEHETVPKEEIRIAVTGRRGP